MKNEEIDAGFKAIENFFTTAFEPVVKRLLSWVMTLVQYVNYLAKAWFGVDILAKSNEKSLKGANKQAKELSKSLTGFDEMNVINDSGGTGVAGGGGIEPLPIPEDIPVPSWLQWIADNGTLVASLLMGIAGGLLGIKFGLDLIQGLGLGVLLAGLVILIKGIFDFIKDPSWDNFLYYKELRCSCRDCNINGCVDGCFNCSRGSYCHLFNQKLGQSKRNFRDSRKMDL